MKTRRYSRRADRGLRFEELVADADRNAAEFFDGLAVDVS
jgi:hypothetical protein